MRVGVLWAAFTAATVAQSTSPRVTFIPYADARSIIETLGPLAPQDVRSLSGPSTETQWARWARAADAGIRQRLAQGEDDSLVNLLLFGTSFTKQPRMTAHQIETIIKSSADPASSGATLDAITQGRLDDLVRAASSSGGERMVFVRTALEARGFRLTADDGRSRAKAYLLHELGRVLKDIDRYQRTIQQAAQSPVAGAAFAVRSGLYRVRGLSPDTSLAPNFAIEQALLEMQARKVLPFIARVAIIGPGLDFADKQEGYDFYPQQTVQPFAVMDTLKRLKVTGGSDPQMTTFDLSPRVNAHIQRLRSEALRGHGYVLQLPLDAGETWQPDFVRYWSAFGDRIGVPVTPIAAPQNADGVKVRAVEVRATMAANITPIDLNVVLQRIEVPADKRFDLVIGTNIFLYYDEFQQALALANIERMMRPGSVLLSNNALVELPSSRLHPAGSTTVAYSDRPDNGDTIVWYKWSE